MDISENITAENSSNSQTSIDMEINEGKIEKSNSLNFTNKNKISLNANDDPQQSTSSSRKLTPVRDHPLISHSIDNEDDDEIENINSNIRNFPDLVLMTTGTSNHHQFPADQSSAFKTNVIAINSVNNNVPHKYKYREPSPVSLIFLCSSVNWMS